MSPPRGFYPERQFRRRSAQLAPKRTMLVLCEGKKTEPNYFGAIKHELLLSTAEVRIEPGKGGGKKLVEKAKKAARRKEADEVWCVFDCDQVRGFPGLVTECESGRARVGAAASNPCIEFWFLLHYEYTHACLSTNECLSRLRVHMPDYDKSKTPVYNLLKDKQAVAMRHAERLRASHERSGNNPKTHNPCTRVDELVKALQSLAEG